MKTQEEIEKELEEFVWNSDHMILIWVICMLIVSGIVYAVIGYIPPLLNIAIAVCLVEGIFYSYFRTKKNIGFDIRKLDVKNAYHWLYLIPIFVSEILLFIGIILLFC